MNFLDSALLVGNSSSSEVTQFARYHSAQQIVPNFPTDPAREWGFGTVFGCGLLSGLVVTLLAAALWLVITRDPEAYYETPRNADGSDKDHHTMHLFKHRCAWLVLMLVIQSFSAVVLSRFADLLLSHPNLVYFLTMLVGAGGSAGAQSAVLVVRDLAMKLEVSKMQQVVMGLKISFVLALVAILRTLVSAVPVYEIVAIVTALVAIVMVSVVIGTLLPLGMDRGGIDPAHSLPVVQVLMDISGVIIVCTIGYALLDHFFDVPGENSLKKLLLVQT